MPSVVGRERERERERALQIFHQDRIVNGDVSSCLTAKKEDINKWHRRLSHPSLRSKQNLSAIVI